MLKTSQIKKIESLQLEVDDFHPVLRDLFHKITNVISVEYHQGPNEKGADFVIVRKDEVLGDDNYIGVICKVGKITQSSTEVERQIDECKTLPRFINGGKKKIYLNEIWIVTNATISNNAEEKIHEKFKGTNIKFFDSEKTVDLINKYNPSYWEYESEKFGRYFAEIEDEFLSYSTNNFFGVINPENFIERKITISNDKKKSRVSESIENTIEKEKFLIIEGSAGCGKSTIIKQLIKKLKTKIDLNKEEIIIPVLIQYVQISQENLSVNKIAEDKLSKYKIPTGTKTIVIIDGIDEVKESFEERILKLRSIVSEVSATEKMQLMVTSRTMDSPKDYEIIDKLFTRYSVTQLSIKQIISFVDKICNNAQISQRIRNGIEKTPLFLHIPRTPISAILLARIFSDEVKELPSTMTELYSKYCEIVLGRWDTSKGLMSQTEYDVIRNVYMETAEYMMDNSFSQIPESEFQDIFINYISKRHLTIDETLLYNRAVTNGEVAGIDKSKKYFSFRHRSFMEFFYAEKLKISTNVEINERIYDMYWLNSYFFFMGLHRDSEQLVDLINNITPTDELHRVLRLFNNGGFYLAAHMTPYSKISEGVERAFVESGQLFDDIIQGISDIPLNTLPPVLLLCIFTKALQNNYSYDFFKKSLDESAKKISNSVDIGSSNLYSHFFVSATLNSLGEANSFDSLLSRKDLPAIIKLGLYHVVDESGKSNANIEKILKNFNKKRKGSSLTNSYIEDLYEVPLIDIRKKGTFIS